MPSTSLTDYQVLSDGNFTLRGVPVTGEPQEKTLAFAVPDDMHISTALARRPLLAFKVRPFQDSTLDVIFDGENILSTSFDTSHTRTYWEAVDLSGPLKQHPSTVSIRFLVLNGRARFGDVVMWYQINR
ncbi:hypothetical protein [Microbacterium cremeum]|uniref:hypothetical protein n=1 Tax=Microbacterium cremeum TaxID=2782169 RepID=UPI00188796D2|nr:hypothetical protein [Microbacterium cremeum]